MEEACLSRFVPLSNDRRAVYSALGNFWGLWKSPKAERREHIPVVSIGEYVGIQVQPFPLGPGSAGMAFAVTVNGSV